jgi:hypothetical protein
MISVRRITVVMLVTAGFSLGMSGCKSGGKVDSAEHPKSLQESDHPKGEHPKGEHPKSEHPKSEHPKSKP